MMDWGSAPGSGAGFGGRLLRRGRRNQHAGRVCSSELPARLAPVEFESRSTEKACEIKTRCPLDSVPHAD